MKSIKKFSNRIKGSYFGFIGVLISLVSIIISIVLFTQFDPSFSFFTDFISFLGVGPNYADIVFNVGVIMSSPFMLLFYLYLGGFLMSNVEEHKELLTIASVGAVFNFIGNIVLAVFTNDLNLQLHLTGAYIAFGAYFALACIFSYVEMNMPEFNRVLAISGFIPCGLLVLHIALLFVFYYPNILPAVPIFIEWVMFFIMMGWIVAQAIYLLLVDK